MPNRSQSQKIPLCHRSSILPDTVGPDFFTLQRDLLRVVNYVLPLVAISPQTSSRGVILPLPPEILDGGHSGLQAGYTPTSLSSLHSPLSNVQLYSCGVCP